MKTKRMSRREKGLLAGGVFLLILAAELIQTVNLSGKIPPIRLRFNISFGKQLLICQFHSTPAHLEITAQCTRRRKLLAAHDMSFPDL